MTERAERLAGEFRRMQDDVVSFVDELSEEQWLLYVPNEQRTVAALMHHIAAGYRAQRALVRAIANGTAVPAAYNDWEVIHAFNARHAAEFERVTKVNAVKSLRHHGDRMLRTIEALTDEQLDRRQSFAVAGSEMSAGEIIEWLVLGHPRWHLDSIQEALQVKSAMY